MNTKNLRALLAAYHNRDLPHLPVSKVVEVWDLLPALLDRLDKLEERLRLADGLAQSLSTYPPETLYFETCFLLKDYYTAKGLTK